MASSSSHLSLVDRLLVDAERERRRKLEEERTRINEELDEDERQRKKHRRDRARNKENRSPSPDEAGSAPPSSDELQEKGSDGEEQQSKKKTKKKHKKNREEKLDAILGPGDAIDERIEKEEQKAIDKKKKKKELKLPPMPPSPPPEPAAIEGRKTRRQMKEQLETMKVWRAQMDEYQAKMDKMEGKLMKVKEKERKRQEKEQKREDKRREKQRLKQQERDIKLRAKEDARKAARQPGDPPEPALIKWAQRHMIVYVTICLADAKIEHLKVMGQNLSFKATDGVTQLSFENSIEFHREIANWRRSPKKNVVELVIEKRKGGWWPRLSTTRGRVPWIGIDEKRWKDMPEFDIGEDDGRPPPNPDSDYMKIKKNTCEFKDVPDQVKPGSRSVATKDSELGNEVTEPAVEVVPSTVNYADGGDLDDLPELRSDTPPPETKKESSSDSENDWQKWYYTQKGRKKRKKEGKSRIYWSGMPNDYYKSDFELDTDEEPFCF